MKLVMITRCVFKQIKALKFLGLTKFHFKIACWTSLFLSKKLNFYSYQRYWTKRFFKKENEKRFSNRFGKSFWSISLIRVQILLCAKIANFSSKQFWNRICISDSCEIFKKSINFKSLKTMPLSSFEPQLFTLCIGWASSVKYATSVCPASW